MSVVATRMDTGRKALKKEVGRSLAQYQHNCFPLFLVDCHYYYFVSILFTQCCVKNVL